MCILNKPSLLAALLMGGFALQSNAASLISFDLNGIYGGQVDSGTQYQTGYSITYNASLTGWTHSGFNAIHALQVTQDNWALMVYSGGAPNVYTLDNPFAANEDGTTYFVSYDIAPTVYVTGDQATRDTDMLRISVLNSEDQVVAFKDVAPGAWDGSQAFHQEYFSYTGDGSGDVRLQITTTNPGNGYFAGAVDNIAFESSQPIPEPSTYVLCGFGICGLTVIFRRLQKNKV